jgi:hypothetical protein
MRIPRELLVKVMDWWLEGDRALGAALVAAKATENRAAKVLQSRSTEEARVLHARAVGRVQVLEKALREHST